MMAAPSTTSLNDLPDKILLHILSLLPSTRSAIVTSYVSRKWRNLWLSTPSLNFYYFTISSDDLQILRRFASFVEKTLIRRPPKFPLHTLRIRLHSINGVTNSQLNSWVRYAVSHNVQNLCLHLCLIRSEQNPNPNNGRFEFPFCVLRDSQVRVLNLGGCNLYLPLSENYTNTTQFFSLRSVTLEGVCMTDAMVEHLMVTCLNLENLVLAGIQGCNDIKICSSTLKELTLGHMKCEQGSLKVVAPNLCSLNIDDCHIGNYVLRDASSLVKAYVNVGEYEYWVKIMSLIGHVKRLRSPNLWFELVQSRDVYSECFMLLNLKHVQLRTCYTKSDLMGIGVILHLSPNLETMILENCSVFIEMMSEGQMPEDSISEDFFKLLDFNMRSLRHVKMESFMGTECEKNFVYALLKMAVFLERITLIPAEFGGMTPQHSIVLDPQFNYLEDLKYVVSEIPRWRKQEDSD